VAADFFAMKVYVVVVVGETIWGPIDRNRRPVQRVALTAFVDVQVSVELAPGAIEVGFALSPAVGAPPPPITVMGDLTQVGRPSNYDP
jgi:hypothetical protein